MRAQARISSLHLVALAALALSLALTTWTESSGDLRFYFSAAVPPGQLLYVLSKACGLASVVLLWVQILAGLSIAGRDARNFSVHWHARLGTAVLVMLLLHWLTFVGAVSGRLQKLAIDYLIPDFSRGFYLSVTSLGIVSLLVIATATLAARARRRVPFWRALHVLAALGALGGAIHSFLIGSETRMPLVKWLYAFMLITLLCAIARRFANRFRKDAA